MVLISHASKIMLKILQARCQQYMYWELPDVQAGLEKAEEPVIKLPTFIARTDAEAETPKLWPPDAKS